MLEMITNNYFNNCCTGISKIKENWSHLGAGEGQQTFHFIQKSSLKLGKNIENEELLFCGDPWLNCLLFANTNYTKTQYINSYNTQIQYNT